MVFCMAAAGARNQLIIFSSGKESRFAEIIVFLQRLGIDPDVKDNVCNQGGEANCFNQLNSYDQGRVEERQKPHLDLSGLSGATRNRPSAIA